MPTVVGVRLRFSKTLWFDPAGTSPVEGDVVVVDTERGTELGTVVRPPHEVETSALPGALKPIVRIADESDLAHAEELSAKEDEAYRVFRELVAQRGLDMKPVDVEYSFDGDRIVFYFSAEERVDFRELVKELASRFRARIDMRQVGVRDEARAIGGVGHCGQVLCCVRFGGDFQPVSIRMAKEQDLPLNPLKISGLCGRLMCCLRYEYDAYKDFKGRAPKRGAMVETPAGEAKVVDLNTLRELVRIRLQDGTSVTVPLTGMRCAKGAGCPCAVDADALEAASKGSLPVLVAEASVSESSAAQLEQEGSTQPTRKRRRRRPAGAGAAEQPQGGGEAPREPQQPAAGEVRRSSRRRRRRRPSGGASGGGGNGAS